MSQIVTEVWQAFVVPSLDIRNSWRQLWHPQACVESRRCPNRSTAGFLVQFWYDSFVSTVVYISIATLDSLFLIASSYRGLLSVKWKSMSKLWAFRHRIWWNVNWLCATAIIQSSDFTVRARYAARLISKDISRTCHGVPRIWNHFVSIHIKAHWGDRLIKYSLICFQWRCKCEVSLFDMWCSRRLHPRSCGWSSHTYLDTADEGTWHYLSVSLCMWGLTLSSSLECQTRRRCIREVYDCAQALA